MRKYCPQCKMWLPDHFEECPVCHGKPVKRTSTMEILFAAIIGVVVLLVATAILMPSQVFQFIQAIHVEFVEIGNGSTALLNKLGLNNDSAAIAQWEQNLSQLIAGSVNSTLVRKVVLSRTKEGEPYLKKVDSLVNYVAQNIRYKRTKNFTDMTDILRTFSGDDRAHVILLAALFNESNVDFRVDLVEDPSKKGRGYHYRVLVRTSLPEEDVRKIVVARIRKKRSGLTGTKAKVWYIPDGEFRWYVIDTTGEIIKQREALANMAWVYIGESHDYYANRSHYSFDLPLR